MTEEFRRTEKMKESFNALINVSNDADFKYIRKEPLKGDSWREMVIPELYKIMMDEVNGFETAMQGEFGKEVIYSELLDVINMARMIAVRVKEEQKK